MSQKQDKCNVAITEKQLIESKKGKGRGRRDIEKKEKKLSDSRKETRHNICAKRYTDKSAHPVRRM
jgi:hypothetical protein